jgi:hypothetical protein
VIAPTINQYIWQILQTDSTLDAKYDKYRKTYGDDFIPFFPVFDNFAGNISWGSEPYILYDSLVNRADRPVYGERKEQVLYTIVGKLQDIFKIRDIIANQFDAWSVEGFNLDGFRVNSIESYQTDRTRGRDSVRQTYSLVLTLIVHYIEC